MGNYVLTLGESLIDVVPSENGPVGHPGGSALTTSVGLGRLGREVFFGTWFGTDAGGQMIRKHLDASHVKILPGSDNAPKTTTASVSFDAKGTASYTFDLCIDIPPIPGNLSPLAVHTGSLGAFLPDAGPKILDYVRSLAGPTITFDPNIRPAVMGSHAQTVRIAEAYVETADVVKVSSEDLEHLYPGRSIWESARAWSDAGTALVLLTLGADGAAAITPGAEPVFSAKPSGSVADTIGAGDTFMAATIHWLWEDGLLGQPLDLDAQQCSDLLAFASRAAAITVSRVGGDPPWLAELEFKS
ncbi:MAG: PfkB family carbohydrate kinase [Propionibacteriaceae bacterium]|jgi:fructokinase|nr:PfkB family carbohydrate kinase [Propionibacteriaceae bacterium]